MFSESDIIPLDFWGNIDSSVLLNNFEIIRLSSSSFFLSTREWSKDTQLFTEVRQKKLFNNIFMPQQRGGCI